MLYDDSTTAHISSLCLSSEASADPTHIAHLVRLLETLATTHRMNE